jgi:hypothetical protein
VYVLAVVLARAAWSARSAHWQPISRNAPRA